MAFFWFSLFFDLLGIAILVLVFLVCLLPVVFGGAPFVASQTKTIGKMLDLARVKAGEKAADLGAGDGRLVIALARAGAEAHGYEINPFLVWRARKKVRQAGLDSVAFIHWGNLWQQNLSRFDVVLVYGLTPMMKKLERKLRYELKPGGRVISESFPFPTWPPLKQEDHLYLYQQT